MKPRLHSLEFLPREGGWHLGPLEFGSFLTFASGENGAGKTPVMKGIVYALGHPLKLTHEVRRYCANIRLTLAVGARLVHIERSTDDDDASFHVRVKDGADVAIYQRETEFTDWLLATLQVPTRALAGKQRGTVVKDAYASVLTPVFWLDQDRGWHVPYNPLRNKDFIRNQGEEAARWFLGVVPRNAAIDRSEQLKTESKLETVEQLMRARQATLAELQQDLPNESVSELAETKRRIIEQLRMGQAALRATTQAGETISEQITLLAASIERLRRKRAVLQSEKRKLESVVREIEADGEVLLANENAADLFRAVCSNPGCQFFRQPAASYGRRLLFVKDQLKDLHAAIRAVDTETERLDRSIDEQAGSLRTLEDRRKAADQAAGIDILLAEVDGLAAQLQRVTLQLVRLEQIAEEERRLASLITRRHALRDSLEQLTQTRRRTDDPIRAVRQALRDNAMKWLGVLKTPNLGDIDVNDNFELTVSGERFNYDSPESGSTRTRFVLAYHAALLETSIANSGHHPPWLICDAPQQHEIKVEDLVAWVEELRRLAKEHSFQLVLSGAKVFASLDPNTDRLWFPQQAMGQPFPQYLGPERPAAPPPQRDPQ
jgi:hypothetical protein